MFALNDGGKGCLLYPHWKTWQIDRDKNIIGFARRKICFGRPRRQLRHRVCRHGCKHGDGQVLQAGFRRERLHGEHLSFPQLGQRSHHREDHHPETGSNDRRVPGLPMREAHVGHSDGHVLLRRSIERGNKAIIVNNDDTSSISQETLALEESHKRPRLDQLLPRMPKLFERVNSPTSSLAKEIITIDNNVKDGDILTGRDIIYYIAAGPRDWKVSELESVRKHFSSKLESVRIGKFQNWKVSKLESVRIGKSQNWKVSESESVKIGKCQNWKVSELESVRII